MEGIILNAYSHLDRVLQRQKLSVPELHRRLRTRGFQVNVKSLYRLSNANQPLERLDMRVAGAICQVCTVPLSEWIVFEDETANLHTLDTAKQARLDTLMTNNNEGRLTPAERDELQILVREAEEITLLNARLLASHRARLASLQSESAGSAA